MSYSAKSTGVPLNDLVSTTSQPTSRKPSWTFSTASGLVTSRFSLQPSKRRPPKSSNVRFWTCRLVPIAPSKTTMRSFRVSRKLAIECVRSPTVREGNSVYWNFRWRALPSLTVGLLKRKPRAGEQRGAFIKLDNNGLKNSPSCLADYFSWPQVALTHHGFNGY